MKQIYLFILLFFTTSISAAESTCIAYFHSKTYQCALGRSGMSANKQEGDGATPIGTYALRQVFYRSDRVARPVTNLPLTPLNPTMGWCDDPHSSSYNQLVKLPFPFSHEDLWRDDNVYNIIVVVGYNDKPIVKNKGSAIFLHIARPAYTPTAGCVTFSEQDLRLILKDLTPKTVINISPRSPTKFNPTTLTILKIP